MLLNPQQLQQVTQAVSELSPAQLAWLGGYLSGLVQHELSFEPLAANQASTRIQTTLLYGTQTGNSKQLAKALQQRLQAQGAEVVLSSLADYRPQRLKQEQRLVVIVSTHGNGEPPDEARAFFKFLQSTRAPRLDSLQFAVLGLGDSSYDEFCQAAVNLEQYLQALGAKPFLARCDCDLDFQSSAQAWQQHVAEYIQAHDQQNPQVPQLVPMAEALVPSSTYSASKPFQAELIEKVQLTDTGSAKAVWHLALDLSGLQYEAGDILVVKAENNPELVRRILAVSHLAAETVVQLGEQQLSLQQVLLTQRELASVTNKQFAQYLQQTQQVVHTDENWLAAADWLDVLQHYPSLLEAQAFVDLLRPLQPRQYSIASSAQAHPDEVHLLVKQVQYTFLERIHLGPASNWLARLQPGEQVAVYVQPNPNFKLPADPNSKIIMIGAGTGVAPFRSFLFEREAQGSQGNSWLFFGEQHFRSDFLYQTEWQHFLKSGVLERMDVAFSRDQAEKIYVQQRLLAAAQDVYAWLQQGAYLYVCGDRHHMAKDVQQALLQIVMQQGGKSAAEAEAWLEQLISERRYQRDVY